MKIKNLPLEIQELIKIRMYEEDGSHFVSLTWASTPEGHHFWADIDKGDFDQFYKLYPKIDNKAKLNSPIYSNGKSIYYGSIKGKRVKITIEYLEDE
jgi:hypothetical protein